MDAKDDILLLLFFRGQNKNNSMLHYLCWLLITGKYEGDITLNFMLAGHTKFSPDQHFGTLKKQFTKTFVSSLPELAQVNQYPCYHVVMKMCTLVSIHMYHHNEPSHALS